MGRYMLAVLMLVVAVGVTWAAEGENPNRKAGEVSGTVVGTESVKGPEGNLLLSLTITTLEGAQQMTFVVGPGTREAYALVGSLKAGEKVRLSWVSETGVQKWIRSIRRLEGDKPREGGDRPREGGDR